MLRLLLLLFPLAIAASAAKPTNYSADMVMLEGGRVMQNLRLYVSGQNSRVEGLTAGPLGKVVAISRKDKGVTWTLYPDKRQYSEMVLAAARPGGPDLSTFDLGNLKREILGRENVLGYACTKMRVTMGNLPDGRPMLVTVWVADSLELPLRLQTMGMVQENRNLKIGSQPASLFEIPAGFTKTSSPGMPAGFTQPSGAAVRADRVVPASKGGAPAAAWKLNTNYPGGDYRSIDMATSNPTACKAACDKEAQCKAWTLVKPGEPGAMGYCWLKDSVPPAISEDCCISGLKGAGGGAPTTPSKYQLELNVNRGGEDYRDFVPARASAVLCAEACAKESRCRAWTWVNSELEPPTGHCWLKNPAPEPAKDDCCVSGVKK